jgi:hypothetical protein
LILRDIPYPKKFRIMVAILIGLMIVLAFDAYRQEKKLKRILNNETEV